MQWFFVRRVVEFLLLDEVWKAFKGCADFATLVDRFMGYEFTTQVGLVVCVLVAGSSIAELLKCIADFIVPPVRGFFLAQWRKVKDAIAEAKKKKQEQTTRLNPESRS